MLSHMAAREDEVYTASRLAERSAVPEPTAAKILKLLARAHILVAQRGSHPVHLGKEGRTGMVARMAFARLRGVACHDGAQMGDGQLPRHRFPGRLLLFRAQAEGGPDEPRRGRSRTFADL